MPLKLGLDLDIKEADAKIKKLEAEWEKSTQKIERQKQKIKELNAELDEHNKLLEKTKESGQDISKDPWAKELKQKLAEANTELKRMEANAQLSEIKLAKASIEANNLKKALETPKMSPAIAQKFNNDIQFMNRLGKALKEIKEAENEAEAMPSKLRGIFSNIANISSQAFSTIGNIITVPFKGLIGIIGNLKGLMSGFIARVFKLGTFVFIFTVISQAFRDVREYATDLINTNEELSTGLAKVRGNLIVAFQPIWETILPYLIKFVEWLVKATSAVAAFFSGLFGKSYKQSVQNAKATYTQIQANKQNTKSLGKQNKALNAQKKAYSDIKKEVKQARFEVSKFDELNFFQEQNKRKKKVDELGKIKPREIPKIPKVSDYTPIATVNEPIFEIPDEQLTENAENVGTKIRTFFTETLPKFVKPVIETVKETVGQIYDNVFGIHYSEELQSKLDAVYPKIKEKLEKGVPLLQAIEEAVKETFGEDSQEVIDNFNSKLQQGENIVVALNESLEETFGNDDDKKATFAKRFRKYMLEGKSVTEALGLALVDTFKDGAKNAHEVEKAINGVETSTDPAIRGIKNMNTILENTKSISEKVGNWISENFEKAKNSVTETWSNMDTWWNDNVSNPIMNNLNSLKQRFSEKMSEMKTSLQDAFSDPYNNIIRPFVNGLLFGLELGLNRIIDGVNSLIRKINGIGFDIPDWLGGGHFGINLAERPHITIPRLASGAVIPPNSPFLAMLGDQRSGTNIEAPLDTIKQAFKEALQENTGYNNGSYTFVAQLDGRTIFEETVRQNDMYINQSGRSAFVY